MSNEEPNYAELNEEMDAWMRGVLDYMDPEHREGFTAYMDQLEMGMLAAHGDFERAKYASRNYVRMVSQRYADLGLLDRDDS